MTTVKILMLIISIAAVLAAGAYIVAKLLRNIYDYDDFNKDYDEEE